MTRALLALALAALAAAAPAGAAVRVAPTIEAAPPDPSASAAATFSFSLPSAAAFRCKLDEAEWTPCSSPVSYAGLADGEHVFRVRGVDEGGKAGPQAVHRWRVDTGLPVTLVSGPPAVTSSARATFAFTTAAAGAECRLDGQPFAPCASPVVLAGLPDGERVFQVRAVDAAGFPGPPASWTWTVDTRPPAIAVGGPRGVVARRTALITFTVDEAGPVTCRLDGGAGAPCSSPLVLAGLAEGLHALEVQATDAAGNVGSASLAWRVDVTAPALDVPSPAPVEADGPGGSPVAYSVTATDRGAPLPPAAVSCTPRAGSTFPLGRTVVGCTATDEAGNRSAATFPVLVRDTTPPAINAPDATLPAAGPHGLRRDDPPLAAYLRDVSATDLVSRPTVEIDLPQTLPPGVTVLTVTARDGAGNTAVRRARLTVAAVAGVAVLADRVAPPPVRRVRARAGDHVVRLTWRALRGDAVAVLVRVTAAGERGPGRLVYRGRGPTALVRRLRNDVRYRFALTAVDGAGNRSREVVVRATPTARLLARPRPNAVLTGPPVFRWAPVAGAAYFNVQLYRGRTKILSAWPRLARLRLPARWLHEGRLQTLAPGTYTWYVWPGYGGRADARYGPPLGKSTFRVTPRGSGDV